MTQKMRIPKKTRLRMMFLENASKHGTTTWNGVELALLHEPFRDFDILNNWCYRCEAMDIDGNVYWVRWDTNEDYENPVEWEKPSYVELTYECYF